MPPPIVQLTGPLLLGHLFNWGLFGCLTVQSYIYYLAFPNDRTLPKVIVGWVVIIETLQTILSTRDAFRVFGTNWGNLENLNEIGWLWFSTPVLGSIITSTAQLFFGWRIYILSQKIYIPAVTIVLSFVQCGAGLWGGIFAHQLGLFSEVQIHASPITSAWLGGAALCDVIIAISMIYYLLKSRTGFHKTDMLLTRLVRVTVETGLICATFAILDLVLFLSFENNNYHLAPSIALSKLYTNSLLVALNARVRIVGGRGTCEPADDFMLSTSLASRGTGADVNSRSLGRVQMSSETNQTDDDISISPSKMSYTPSVPHEKQDEVV
ncbi:hypothetical protein BU17DRAFT_94035 [Hysterangium stoloniferum]|nr:hypothetical protein BU17DRAFT_94035 [Hysterangium stoloniferum]